MFARDVARERVHHTEAAAMYKMFCDIPGFLESASRNIAKSTESVHIKDFMHFSGANS